jgi:hypothetical protein
VPVERLLLPELEDPPEEPELSVEYFVVVLELDSVRISVPKSVHSSQTSSSAPSILTRFGLETSEPHISHCTMAALRRDGV